MKTMKRGRSYKVAVEGGPSWHVGQVFHYGPYESLILQNSLEDAAESRTEQGSVSPGASQWPLYRRNPPKSAQSVIC